MIIMLNCGAEYEKTRFYQLQFCDDRKWFFKQQLWRLKCNHINHSKKHTIFVQAERVLDHLNVDNSDGLELMDVDFNKNDLLFSVKDNIYSVAGDIDTIDKYLESWSYEIQNNQQNNKYWMF